MVLWYCSWVKWVGMEWRVWKVDLRWLGQSWGMLGSTSVWPPHTKAPLTPPSLFQLLVSLQAFNLSFSAAPQGMHWASVNSFHQNLSLVTSLASSQNTSSASLLFILSLVSLHLSWPFLALSVHSGISCTRLPSSQLTLCKNHLVVLNFVSYVSVLSIVYYRFYCYSTVHVFFTVQVMYCTLLLYTLHKCSFIFSSKFSCLLIIWFRLFSYLYSELIFLFTSLREPSAWVGDTQSCSGGPRGNTCTRVSCPGDT